MSMFMLMFLNACATGVDPTAPAARPSSARVSNTGVVVDCGLVTSCGVPDLDPERCVSEPSWFEASYLDGKVVAVTLAVTPEETGLSPGGWYTLLPGGTGTCADIVILEFEVSP